MNTLLLRLVRFCVCTAALTLMTVPTAKAGGNGSLFASGGGIFGVAADPMDMPRSRPLLYTGIEPVEVEIEPEQIFPARVSTAVSERDLDCMAEALYHEARGEGLRGQQAVAEVILNRVDSKVFPGTVCGVINQPSQFSYTIGGAKPISNKAAYLHAREIAAVALSGAPRDLTGGATYFHTPAVNPSWSRRFERTVQIGQHIFYRTGQRLASN